MSDYAWSVFRDLATLVILCATVWATIHGPARALNKQEAKEAAREKARRQFNILHQLMRTRAWVLHEDHVSALNLIQLEFYGEQAIQDAYRRYREHLDIDVPSAPSMAQLFEDDRKDRFYTMVKAIADLLKYSFDKSDLRRLSYSPRGWHDDISKQRAAQALLIQMLEGKRPIPIQPWHPSSTNSKFPPPPEV